MKTIKKLGFAALAALAALAVTLLFQTSITRAVAKDKGHRGHGHTLHLRAYFTSFHSTQAGAGLAVGDQLTFGGTLARIESPNEQIGSVGAHFAVTAPGGPLTAPGGAELLGNGCLILPDGKVSFQILIGEKDWAGDLHGVITGGTGAYRNARGEYVHQNRADGGVELIYNFVGN